MENNVFFVFIKYMKYIKDVHAQLHEPTCSFCF